MPLFYWLNIKIKTASLARNYFWYNALLATFGCGSAEAAQIYFCVSPPIFDVKLNRNTEHKC